MKWSREWLFQPSLSEEEQRWRVAATEGWVSTGVNLVLAALKALASAMSGSLALLADAFHSLSDVATSLIIVFSYRLAKQPSDERHPFGHGRAEQTAALIVAILLIVAGLELAKAGVARIVHPRILQANVWVIEIVVLTIVVKELLAQFSGRLARAIDSKALRADTWHHRTDALSSLLVLLALLLSRAGFLNADGVAGLLVAGFVVFVGGSIARDSVSELLGHGPTDSLVEQIKGIALEHPEVLDAHDVIVHQYGRQKVISLHIGLSKDTEFERSHEIAEEVEASVNQRLGAHTTVHVDPVADGKELDAIREALRTFGQEAAWLLSFHDVRLVKNEDGSEDLLLDLVVDPNLRGRKAEEAVGSLRQHLRRLFPTLRKIEVQMEPPFAK